MLFFTFYSKTIMYRVSYLITSNGKFSGPGEVVESVENFIIFYENHSEL